MTTPRKHNIHPLGILRPASKHKQHELKINLVGDKGQWTTTLNLDTRPEAKPQFLIVKIGLPLRRPTGEMKQLANAQSEFTIRIMGPMADATIVNLSPLPIQDWMPTMFAEFAQNPAALAVLCSHGRVSVTLHGGD